MFAMRCLARIGFVLSKYKKKVVKHVRSFLAAICYSWKAYHFKCISETRTFSLWLPPHPSQFFLVLFLSIQSCVHVFSIRYTLCIIMWNHIIQFVNLPFGSDSCHSLFTCFMPIKTWKRTTFVGDSGISPDAAVPVRQSWQISDGVQSFRLPNSVWPFAWIQEEVMLWLNSSMNYYILFSHVNFHLYRTKMETCVLIIYIMCIISVTQIQPVRMVWIWCDIRYQSFCQHVWFGSTVCSLRWNIWLSFSRNGPFAQWGDMGHRPLLSKGQRISGKVNLEFWLSLWHAFAH